MSGAQIIKNKEKIINAVDRVAGAPLKKMYIVGAHSICARKAAACVRADMESAPTFLFSTNGRKLHNLYYLSLI
ncbi:MAG: hypothetical protein Q3W87_08920, partial [Gemmiger sp.]|nr:hypothetical protein [Gemmiger sp.]